MASNMTAAGIRWGKSWRGGNSMYGEDVRGDTLLVGNIRADTDGRHIVLMMGKRIPFNGNLDEAKAFLEHLWEKERARWLERFRA